MKLMIDKNTLVVALNTVTKAVMSKVTLEVLTGVEIHATSEFVTLLASNPTMGISYKVPVSILDTDAQVDAPGRLIVPAKKLLELVKKMPKGKLQLTTKETNLHIKGGKTEMELLAIDGEMPAFERFTPSLSVYLNSTDLYKAFRVGFAASDEQIRPALQGINIGVGPNGINTCATDSHRLALSTVSQFEGEKPSEVKQLLPYAGDVDVAIAILPLDEDVLLQANDALISFSTDVLSVYLRQIEGIYPDVSRILPRESDAVCRLNVDRKEFVDALDRALILAPSGDSNKVCLSFEQNEIKLTSKTKDVGKMSEVLPAHDGEGEITIYFNAKYLYESLVSLKCENVSLRFHGQNSPFMIEAEPDTHLILPIRHFE